MDFGIQVVNIVISTGVLGTNQCFNLQLVDDSVVEPTESFSLQFMPSSDSANFIMINTEAVVMILNNDCK